MRTLLYAFILFSLLSSCNKQEDSSPSGNDLAAKNAALAKLKNQQSDLAKKITALEAEIIKLDPSKAIQPKLVSVAEIAPEGFEEAPALSTQRLHRHFYCHERIAGNSAFARSAVA